MFKKSDVKDIYDLTPMQAGILFHYMMQEGSYAYFQQLVFPARGHIDTERFEKALNKVIDKYDVLRTVFLYKNVNKPVQVVLKQRKAVLDSRDISHLPEEEKKSLVEQSIRQDKEKGFDLEKDIPMRVTIIKTANLEYTIIWSHHHIIMDGWCIGLVISDFFRFYYAYKEGKSIPAETAPPYSRYLRWLGRQDRDKGLRFWQTYLEGYEQKASVPLKRPVSPNQGEYFLEEHHLLIDEIAASALDRIAKENEVTLNVIFQVIWGLILQRYNNTDDVVFGAVVSARPPEIDEVDQIVGLFINTIPVRAKFDINRTFAQLITAFQEKEVPTKSHEYLILADIQAQTPLKRDLLDHILVFENYPLQANMNRTDRQVSVDFNILGALHYHEQSNYDFNIVISPGEKIGLRFSFNSLVYHLQDIIRVASHIKQFIHSVIEHPHRPVKSIEIIAAAEKQQLLYEFNGKEAGYPKNRTIHELFQDQAQKTPDHIAVSSPVDLIDIYDHLAVGSTINPGVMEKLAACCFQKNPYLYHSPLSFPGCDKNLILLKTHRHNSIIINKNMETLLGFFSGRVNLGFIYSSLKDLKESKGINPEFLFYPMDRIDLLEISVQFNREPKLYSIHKFEDLVQLVQLLHNTSLLELVALSSNETKLNKSFCGGPGGGFLEKNPLVAEGIDSICFEHLLTGGMPTASAQVLLLGDTPGMPTTGLLYLASYLQRKGINAYCQFYDPSRDYNSMKKNIQRLLQTLQPKVVAVSMKWFLYIARVIDTCTVIKDYSRKHSLDITVVVGGNTASYYWEEIIKNDCIDILVRGDGEEPLLKICQEEDIAHIPNCVYKKEGRIIENPVTYIQDEDNSRDIYLSHLDKILLSSQALRFGTFFIYTHKGCGMNCLYCGGCNRAQQKTFNRKKVLRRGIEEVRKDITAARSYTSTFHFEFDVVDTKENLLDYCKKIWDGIDLSRHFCVFSILVSPPDDLIRLLSRTFKYVYWDFDICTLSERHRKQLFSMGLVKPQPTDAGILEFMARCSRYDNIEVRINMVTGLPYFRLEDIEPGEMLLSKIITYSSFGELHWARLHAQPGAPIVENPGKHRMHSYAAVFDDFLKFSKENFNPDSSYAFVDDLVYPYIYFEDDRLNSKITNLYLETNRKVDQIITGRRKGLIVSDTLTYRELNEAARQLCEVLRAKEVRPGQIVGLMLERSIDIPVGILGIMKAGCAYMPIDPEFPGGRIEYMLKDSNARILIKKSETRISKSETIPNAPNSNNQNKRTGITVLDLEHLNFEFVSNFEFRASNFASSNPAYVIYTSGTTGNPKGVLLTHENLVNYVHWFSSAAGLTPGDKTILTSSFAFDLGYTSLYTSILNGGQLHILPREMYLLAEQLLDYIKQQGITYLKVTPSLFSVIINSPNFSADTCRSLRVTAIGGEAINVTDIEKAHSLCPHIQIMNHYGPTEATIGCAATFVDFDNFTEYKTRPVIGNPIYNTGIYILGKDSNLLPVGVPGELCTAGTCLARGYLNRPELTAGKFLPGPIGFYRSDRTYRSYISRRIYHTGDLARWLPDGTIEFLGRMDKQVKVRGYRVELEEIENRLLKHSEIKNALVVVKDSHDDKNGDKYLCAYIVPTRGKRRLPPPSKIHPGEYKPVTGGEISTAVRHFGQQVKTGSDRIAVKSNSRSLTYESLNQLANRLSHKITREYDDRYRLSKSERERYKRQLLLHDWGIASQEKLKSTTVFVAGAGGGASPTIMQLALAGFGTIIVCDCDVVELSNLNRQFLHDETRIGMNKAISAKMTIERINPHLNVIPVTQRLTRENVFELVGNADVILDMFDGLEDKFILSECAIARGIPHIISAMTDINGYAAVFHPPETPCYHCIFDREKLEEMIRGMSRYMDRYEKNPLPVASSSLFISTGFAVNETIKIVLGFENPTYNKFMFFNQRGTEKLANTQGYKAMTYNFSEHFRQVCKDQGFDWDIGWRGNFLEELKITPNPNCPLCGNKGKEKRNNLEEVMRKAKTVSFPAEMKAGKNRTEKDMRHSVALVLGFDINTAVAIAAAAKSGKTYVPLVPGSSLDTLSFMLEDSEARIILTDNEHLQLAEKLRKKVNKNIKVINIDALEESEEPGQNTGRDNPDVEIEPGAPAYILYSHEVTGEETRMESPFHAALPELHQALLEGDGDYLLSSVKNRENQDSTLLSDNLRQYLLEEIPDYMIPSYFVQLEKIPLTPNGKVDIKALPEPGTGETREKVIAPGSEVEKKLADIWSEVLEIEKDKIGINSNFFQLGGHSLKATILIAKIHNQFNLRIPLNRIFQSPTLLDISKIIHTTQMIKTQEIDFAGQEVEEVVL